jgi:hypothetical protein
MPHKQIYTVNFATTHSLSEAIVLRWKTENEICHRKSYSFSFITILFTISYRLDEIIAIAFHFERIHYSIKCNKKARTISSECKKSEICRKNITSGKFYFFCVCGWVLWETACWILHNAFPNCNHFSFTYFNVLS